MCGIFGVLYADGTTTPGADQLRRSAQSLNHRGPDAHGVYAAPGIGLAHTRLSLVDLDERSNQPFWDASGRFCLVYNGELYDFRQLREELQSRGIVFRTTSDTEVLLQALIADGAARTLPRLSGMFALAFHDRETGKTVIARDRFGIKPLNVFQNGQQLVFASEVKAMLPWIEVRADGLQVLRYLMGCGAPVRDHGFFEGVRIMAPGTMLECQPGQPVRSTTFADLPGMIDRELAEKLEAMSAEQVVDHVDEQLQASVRGMLFADAAVGALCSGGVDSSVLMAMAARHHSNLAIFHADVVGPLSERDAAAALAKHLKLDLMTVQTHDDDFIETTPDVLYHYEQPFSGHPHSVPFLMVSRLVQQHKVKAVLTGEGSDECFLGYNHIAHEPFWAAYTRQTQRLAGLVRRVPVIGHMLWPVPGPEGLVIDAMGQFAHEVDAAHARSVYVERMRRQPGKGVRSIDLLANHLRTLLHRNDRMGMAASIEARFPFLDERLVATAINLPYRHKIRFSADVWEKEHPFLRDKWVLRAVAARYLPKVLSARKKRGFDVAAFSRLKIDKRYFQGGFVADFLHLTPSETELLVDRSDQRTRIRLMMLEVWHELFMQGTTVDRSRERLRRNASFATAAG